MRLTDETKFPYPILGPFTGDYDFGDFSVTFEASENKKNGALSLRHTVNLTHAYIQNLVVAGVASVGCIVKCGDTYYNVVHDLSFDSGKTDFAPGSLLNKVTLRPIIWLNEHVEEWKASGVNSEFSSKISLRRGDVIAIGAESHISVGQAKLAPIESIFALESSVSVQEGEVCIDLDSECVSILVAPKTFELIGLLRQQSSGEPVIMNSVYLPAVMEVLDRLREDDSVYQDRRWYNPFKERCRSLGITISAGSSIIEGAQKILERPLIKLEILVREE